LETGGGGERNGARKSKHDRIWGSIGEKKGSSDKKAGGSGEIFFGWGGKTDVGIELIVFQDKMYWRGRGVRPRKRGKGSITGMMRLVEKSSF